MSKFKKRETERKGVKKQEIRETKLIEENIEDLKSGKGEVEGTKEEEVD